MNIAQAFPARRQPDGTTWYRGAELDGKLADGWTPTLALAHPDYRAADAPEPIDTDPAELNYRPPTDQEIAIMASAVGRAFDAAMARPAIEVTFTNVSPDFMALLQPQDDEQPAPPTKETPPPMTALTADFETYAPPRFTQWMHYPLPPAPPRAKLTFNRWGWYRLPHPTTGVATGFPRATTIAETLDDHYGLNRWKRRETATRIYQLSLMPPNTVLSEHFDTTAAEALAALETALNGTKVTAVDDVLDTIDCLLGGAHARELGECVHAWLEALCLGMVLYRDVPALVLPHIDAAFKVMAHRGIISRPEYIERVVLNDWGQEETVAGRIDCIWELADTGELVLGDWKTNKDLKYSWLSYGVQVGGVYGWATKMLTTDGKGWEPMPKLRGIPHPDDHASNCPVRDAYPLFDESCPTCQRPADARSAFAILLHVPSDQPEHAAAITIDMRWGAEVMAESLTTRRRRKEAKVKVPCHAIPVPSDRALRIVAARLALSKITSPADGQAVYETYQDVWNDDLGEFAAAVAELL